MPIYRQSTELPYDVQTVFAWHKRPGALERLTPPFEDVEVLKRTGGIADGGTVTLSVKKAGMRVRWKLQHGPYEENRLFSDHQVQGPFAKWEHRHLFHPTEGGCRVEDEVDWEPPLGAIGQLMGGGAAERELRRLFDFRYTRLRTDLGRHAGTPPGSQGLSVAITGASGFMGSSLANFLETGGHRVIRMTRRRPAEGSPDVYWDYRRESIQLERIEGVDAVVHLAGEPLHGGRWDEAKKRAIRESRARGTRFLAESLALLRPKPRVLLSGSAIGIYGDRGNQQLVEESATGKGFLADVCRDWEAATKAASDAGIRTVHLRSGLVLSPAGGALPQMLLPFRMGAGGRLGRGRQFISWVDHDDAIGMIHHALVNDSIRGALNVTAPYPVTNATFTSTLGRVLGRPTLIPVPSLAIKAMFGEMGATLLLEGARVLPRKAEQTGFSFAFPGLEESLRYQLGRSAD